MLVQVEVAFVLVVDVGRGTDVDLLETEVSLGLDFNVRQCSEHIPLL